LKCSQLNEKYLFFLLAIMLRGGGGCGNWQPTGELTAQVDWLGLSAGNHLASTYIHQSNELILEVTYPLVYYDSTVHTVMGY